SMVPYGQGRQFNPDNIPLGAINFNEKYGEYGGYAYIPDTDQKREIYLTFDEGYENGFTGKILDTLKEKNAHATFFLTGHYVETQPELIQRMIDEGHLLGNHGDKHKSLPEELLPKSITDAENELLNCHNAVLEKFNYEMHISRPPKGEFSPRSLALTQRLGYKSFLWSFAYADWDPSKQPEPAESLKRITETAHAGEIMLLHPVSSTNCEILGDIIDNLQEQGYTFTTPSV
ncbi:MAG: polysaccharide deacetylase family protein, partial [Oscillospiraceae bacterium]